MIEFQPWPKTPRLFRDMVITEKIDGTNAAVIVRKLEDGEDTSLQAVAEVKDESAAFDTYYEVAAQSRKRLITPEDDNFGFARWVRDNAVALVRVLGEGVHFGEWWGSGIQRGYGLTNGARRFSLFNVNRYADVFEPEIGLTTVPVLYRGPFSEAMIRYQLKVLADEGSFAAMGFARPEGVVVFHEQAGQVFKALVENDHQSKTEALELAA